MLLLLALPAGDALAADAAAKCQLDQLSAARKLYRDSLRCWAKSVGQDDFEALACLVKPEGNFAQAYAKAAAKAAKRGASCGLQLSSDTLLARAAQDVDPLAHVLTTDLQAQNRDDVKLRAKLEKAAAAFATQAFAAEIKHAKKSDASKRAASYAKAREKLLKTFAKAIASAQKHEVVYGGLDAEATADWLAAVAAYWADLTRPNRPSHSLSGTIFAAESTFVDSDVNDLAAPPVFNGTFPTAQVLPVPATIGGYVNLAGAGPNGNSRDTGDPFDTYHVALKAGQVVVLVLGDDPALVDLDMCLYGPTIPLGVCAEGIGGVEVIPVPADSDDYFIDVFPYENCNCGSNYVLSVAQNAPDAALRAERTDVEFVPGELIVRMRQSASPLAAGQRTAGSALPLEPVAGDPARELLVRLPASSAARRQSFSALGAAGAHRALTEKAEDATPEEQLRRETVLALKALRGRPEIESAELNTILRPSLVPSDPLYTLQWHYPMIGLPQAWDATTGSADVVVAVIDTGVVLSHPDLAGKLVPGYDFISNATRARDGNGIDADPNDPGDLSIGGASSFHGTHVAGTIGAASNNDRGIAGVAWGASVMPVRVLGLQGGTAYDVLQGVRFAAGLPNDSATVPPHRADVINLSLTGGGFSQIAQDLFDDVRQVGTVVVGAAGNDATSVPSFPASYAGVLSVSAVDLNRRLAPYSNYGAAIDLAAPGGDTSVDRNGDSWADGVLSTLASDASGGFSFTYSFYQGTSMAAPHVAGVVALMKSVNPTLTPAQVDTILTSGMMTEDLGAPGRDSLYGHGLIDASAAVLAAGAVPSTPTPTLAVTPSGLSFGLALVEIELVLSNASQMAVSVTSISNDSGGWLTVTPVAIDGDGLGRYHATVNRTGLAEGSYTATIAIVSTAGTTNVPVVMRIGGPVTSDAGYHYVALVDAVSLEPLDEFGVAAIDGTYSFHFENVPEGDYLLITGSDLDNDGFICDGGEACGSYPTLDGAVPIHLDGDVANANFGTGFRQSIGVGAAGAVQRSGGK